MSEERSRLSSFKNSGKGNSELRRKRVELSVALRKKARDEQILKRRAFSPESGETETKETEVQMTPEEILQHFKTGDLAKMNQAARAARRILSREQNPPIAIMINHGIIKPLVAALDRDECKDLQFEAAWALTNIASGNSQQTMAVVNGGAIPPLVRLLGSGGAVSDQAAWALGNIAGDGAQARDIVLSNGALPALLPSLNPSTPLNQLRTAVWTYSNLCRNKNPQVDFDKVSPALPYIANLLEVNDNDVLSDCCWALSYLTDGPNERIEAVQLVPTLLERLIPLLAHKFPAVITPALRAVGNMVTGSDVQTDRCLPAVQLLCNLLSCGRASLVKEAAWAISNVLAGTNDQIQYVIDNDVLRHLVRVIAEEEARCQKEAAWAITNLCQGGSGPQLGAFIQVEGLQPYCALLDSPDHRTVSVVLDGIINLLQAADKHGNTEELCFKLEEIGALDRIESLQNHESEQIYSKVREIMDKYFLENEDENTKPAESNDAFEFNAELPNQHIQF